MGVSKVELFSPEVVELAQLAKALGHPARIAILQHLLSSNQCITGDLVDEIGLSQPTISQHLKVLKDIGIIKGTVEGSAMCYCIDAERWSKIKETIGKFFDGFSPDEQCC